MRVLQSDREEVSSLGPSDKQSGWWEKMKRTIDNFFVKNVKLMLIRPKIITRIRLFINYLNRAFGAFISANLTYEPNGALISTTRLKRSYFNCARAARESPYTLCAFTSALEKCEKICASHSYREADGKICNLFEFYWETDTLKCYGESRTLSKKKAQTKKTDEKRRNLSPALA